jgi:hypothetical protein
MASDLDQLHPMQLVALLARGQGYGGGCSDYSYFLSKALNCHAWFAIDLVSRSTFGKSKWAGLTYIGWQGM